MIRSSEAGGEAARQRKKEMGFAQKRRVQEVESRDKSETSY